MYQSTASNVFPVIFKECLGVPLIIQTRRGKSNQKIAARRELVIERGILIHAIHYRDTFLLEKF